MKIKICLIILAFASISFASDLKISNLNIRLPVNQNAPATIYLDIENVGEETAYLVGVDIENNSKITTSINKTVIENNVARIIKIDRLAIPSKTTVKLAPIGIYIVLKNLPYPFYLTKHMIKFHFIEKNKSLLIVY